jgi:cyanate lyase
MTVSPITEKLLAAKKAAGLSFADLEAKTGYDEVWIASVFYRQASAAPEEAAKLIEILGPMPRWPKPWPTSPSKVASTPSSPPTR